MKTHNELPRLGFGLGLRPKHYQYIFDHWPEVDWFEIISENFMDTDGKPKRNLARIKERYPVVMHGVGMSIGTADPLNSEYLQKLKALIAWLKPAWISDHLCWTGMAHRNTHDLLPVPYTEEALRHIVMRIKEVQDYLERPLALENPSTYLEFKHSTMPEAEFIARMAEESGCRLLLDVNNVYVTCYNHRLDPKTYIDTLPLDRVIQIHLSGHSNKGTHIIDTHDDHVVDEVWSLYKYVVHKTGHAPNTMIEWDDHIPEFETLSAELDKAKKAAKDTAGYAPLPDLAREQIPQRVNHAVSLKDAETRMCDAIVQGEELDSQPDSWIRSKELFSPQEQLNVYVNAYRYRLNDVTAEDYPVLEHYLGKEAFNTLIWTFVNTVTSDHFNIGRYAAKLPEFTLQYCVQDRMAYEICQLETAISQLTDPEETKPLTQQDLQGMTPDALMESVLKPRKALQLMAFTYPVNRYYCAFKDEQSPSVSSPEASYVAIYRHDDRIWRMDLEEAEYQLLTRLFNGVKIGEAFENIEESVAPKISGWFSRWACNGLLAKHEYTNTGTLNKGNTYAAA